MIRCSIAVKMSVSIFYTGSSDSGKLFKRVYQSLSKNRQRVRIAGNTFGLLVNVEGM